MTEVGDDGKSVSEILDYYGNQVHEGVGHAAYHHPLGGHGEHPITLVELREADGVWMGETSIEFERLNGRAGCLVRIIDDRNTEYYSLLEENIKPSVHKLVTNTDFLIKEVSDYYDESFDYQDGDRDYEMEMTVTSPNHQPQTPQESATADFGSTD